MRSRTARRGYTLLEVFLVLIITGVLIAAIASAINIHLRVSEVGRTEVEQAQLARALLARIADDIRNAVPHIEPVESAAGATSDDIASAAAAASSALGGTGAAGATGGGATSGGTSSGGRSSSGGTSSGGSSGSSGGSGTQTLQPLQKLGTLSALKPMSAGSSSSSASGGSSSSGGSSTAGGSSSASGTESESSDETTTVQPPGIYGTQVSLLVDVSRAQRPGTYSPVGIAGDAPGDVKTVRYELVPYPGTTPMADGAMRSALCRQSVDRAAASFNATAGSTDSQAFQVLAEEVSSLEFRYFDGTAWQTSWDSSGGTLPKAVEIAITLNPPATSAISSSKSLTLPQVHRLTVAIPAAQGASTSTDSAADTSTSSSAETTP